MKNLILISSFLLFFNSYAQFGEQQVITTAVQQVTSLNAADIDGDGNIDVLATSYEDNKLIWYKNLDGLGSFSESLVIDDNLISSHDAFIADVDGDGDMDVVAISRYNISVKLAWYENIDGLGNFSEEQIIYIDDFDIHRISSADIDGDGDIDIVTSNYKKLTWFENLNGLGDFSDQIIISEVENSPYPFSYNFPVDIDGDGALDIVSSGSHMAKIAWFKNLDGLGTFAEEQIITIDNLIKIKDIHAADLDGDGDVDVLSASRDDGKIAWYENTDGLGTFGEQQLISSPEELYGFSVVAADIDNDGDMDVISGRGDDYVNWYENLDGLGNFSEVNIISTEVDGVTHVLTSDLNNDGNIDVLSASNLDNKIAWYENLGELGFGDFLKSEIEIYPNPTKNTIYIQSPILINNIKIYDVLGKLVLEEENPIPTMQLDISNVASGLLLVQIETDKGFVVKMVVKE